MSWKKEKKKRLEASKLAGKSFRDFLRSKKRSNEEFEVMLNNLRFEEIIALKFELMYKEMGYLSGLPVWTASTPIMKEAMLIAVCSLAHTKTAAAALLGLRLEDFSKFYNKYQIQSYFDQMPDWVDSCKYTPASLAKKPRHRKSKKKVLTTP